MDFFGTEKYFRNRAPESIQRFEEALDRTSNREWFMSSDNVYLVKSELIVRGVQFDDLELRAKMGVWARKNKIDLKFSAESNSTRQSNPVLVRKAINASFIKYAQGEFTSFDKPLDNRVRMQEYKNQPSATNRISDNDYNDTFDSETVIQDGILTKSRFDEPDHATFQSKCTNQMTACDVRNMDVYDPKYDRDLYAQAIGMSMKRQRRNDMQKYMHARHVYGYKESEDNPDGYRTADADRSSLDNLSRGFDMSKFVRNANNSRRPESALQFQS